MNDPKFASGRVVPFATNVYAKDLDWFTQAETPQRLALFGVLDEPYDTGEHVANAPAPVRFMWTADVRGRRIDAHCSRPVDLVMVERVARRVATLCDDPGSGWAGLLSGRGKTVKGSVGFTVAFDPATGTITVEPDARCTLPLLRFGAADLARVCGEGVALQAERDALSAEIDRIATTLGALQTVVNGGGAVVDPRGTAAELARASARLNGWHALPALRTPRYRGRSDLAADLRTTILLVDVLKSEVAEGHAQARGIRATAAALAYLSNRVRAEKDPGAFRMITRYDQRGIE